MYDRILAYVKGNLWAIRDEYADVIAEILNMRAAGLRWSAEEIQARIPHAAAKPKSRQEGVVAVVPVFGVLGHRMGSLNEMSGGTSTERLGAELRALDRDPNVSAVVLDVDSPGGSVAGLTEIAATIRELRRNKPVVAVSNAMMASAAYWIGSQATEVVASPSSMIGSIGVLSAFVDESQRNEKEGVKVTVFRSGPNKGRGTGVEPLTEAAAAELQGHVDYYAGLFRGDVAKGRGVSVPDVRDRFGEGAAFTAKDAVSLGLADRVATLDEVLADLAAGRLPTSRATAAESLPVMEAVAAAEGSSGVMDAADMVAPPPSGQVDGSASEEPEAPAAPADLSDLQRRRLRLRLLELQ